jgi:hypothetical protein
MQSWRRHKLRRGYAPVHRLFVSSPNERTTALNRRDFLQTAGKGIALGALAPELFRPPSLSEFVVKIEAGAIVSLKRAGDAFDTDYVQSGRRLGDAVVSYRRDNGAWTRFETASFAERAVTASEGGAAHVATYRPPNAEFELRVELVVADTAMHWKLHVENLASTSLEIGDLALPLPMNSNFREQPTTAVLKHGLISGHGSFLFWMRRNSVGPYLTLTPDANTSLEYWEAQGGYRVFIHSAAAGGAAKERGTKWRMPNTSVTLAARGRPGSRRSYGFTLHWAPDYEGVRQILVRGGLVDVQVVPGMTVPRDLFARIALRTSSRITAVTAEFPSETTVRSLGTKGDASLYEVRFGRLGENRLTVAFGDGGSRRMYLDFFSTEPVETMIAKRAAFIAAHQHRDPSKWYDGLLAEWAMDTKVLLGPDNYDRIKGWRIYEVTCDDPGLSKPAFLAAKSAEHPVQSEVSAVDYYIEKFVWGGLQRTTDEEYPYAIYGIPDWKQNRESKDPGRNGRKHFWRIYDYPHVTLMYFGMYRVAKHHGQIRTALAEKEYLGRAYGTAVAMFTIPYEIERWSAYQTGLYNELVIPDVIDALEAEGMLEQADRLRMHWERKVRAFIADRPDLFRSEYPFDSTGFESTHALVKYALANAESLGRQRPPNEKAPPIARETMRQFLELQMQANLFCRGWLEPAYWLHGSDIRGSGGNSYTLTYMSQMGGWSVLDYALHHASDFAPYLRLGYASALSSWALLNSGTAESNYGYWYPGRDNDGGAGGGFEPAPFGNTWLEQPHHRGSWYYSCEIDLGYCGALRCARTVLADDPLFGRFCFGGDWRAAGGAIEVVPKDGVRRRFHAVLGAKKLHVTLHADRFARGKSLVVNETLTTLEFELESTNAMSHPTRLSLGGTGAGSYVVRIGDQVVRASAKGAEEVVVELPVNGAGAAVRVEIGV